MDHRRPSLATPDPPTPIPAAQEALTATGQKHCLNKLFSFVMRHKKYTLFCFSQVENVSLFRLLFARVEPLGKHETACLVGNIFVLFCQKGTEI